MGKPIIHSLEDAIAVFYTTGLDVLIFDDYLVEKNIFKQSGSIEDETKNFIYSKAV